MSSVLTMDIDGVLPALPSGPRGVAGGLLARLEQQALEEQAALEAAARGERPSPAGPANDDRPTYVPGQKRSDAVASSSSNNKPVSSSTSTLRDGSAFAGTSSNNNTTNTTTTTTTTARHQSPAEPVIKKPRIQPTIRMQFTFPPYPPGKDPIAKHVPIFNVRELAESKGLLLPSEDVVMDDASSSGGSDDEGGDEEAAAASGDNNEGGAEVSEAPVAAFLPSFRLLSFVTFNAY